MSEIPQNDNSEINPVAAEWAEAMADNEPTRLNVGELDFDSVEETFSKIADPAKAVAPEFVSVETPIETVFRREDNTEYVETTNTAQPGDAIITGPKGEQYVLTPEEFGAMYEPLVDENGETIEGQFLPKNVVKRIKNPTGQEIVIDAPWGGDQNGEADCWLVESQINGDRYIIEASAFEATYKPTV